MRRFLIAFLLCMSIAGSTLAPALAQPAADQNDAALWEKLKNGGYTVLIRHAETDAGIGDPEGFEIGKCSTQRNLSSQRRAHAQRIGSAFQAQGVPVGSVYTSRWCRCVDTAQLAFGQGMPNRMLNSIFNDRSKNADEKLREVKAATRQPLAGSNLVLVTHNYNIDAIAGVSTAPGEIVVLQNDPQDALKTIGRLQIP